MKTLKSTINKIIPAVTACLTFVLFVSANSNSSAMVHQPKTPKGIERFSKIK